MSYNFDEHDDIAVMRTAYDLGSDAVSFELEDHVPPGKKVLARSHIREVLDEMGRVKPTFVRINRTESPLILDDLDAIVSQNLHAVLVPKVEHPHEIVVLDSLLSLYERRAGLEPGTVLITPLLESAQGNRLAYDIAFASSRIAYMGGMVSRNGDPALSIGFEWTPTMDETVYIRQKVLLDVRSAGVRWPLSGNWNPIDDLAGLEAFAIQSRRIGYVGLTCMPVPEHVEVINRVFTPDQAEIDYWAEVIPLVEAAETDVVIEGVSLPPNKAKWGRSRLALAAHFGVVPAAERKRLDVDFVGGASTHLKTLVDATPTGAGAPTASPQPKEAR